LATDPRFILSRYIPLDYNRPKLSVDENEMRFLVVVSQPKMLEAVLGDQVIEAIQSLSDNHRITVDKLVNPTIDQFLLSLDEVNPHVLHFIGHGQYDRNKNEGQIAMVKPDGESAGWLNDFEFTEYIDRTKPRLVVLQACEGGAIDFTNNFSGVAPQLVRKNIPAVVAMQYKITNLAAIRFSRTFYEKLAQGEPVDAAVQEGRKQITLKGGGAYNNRDFGTPILFMRSFDGIIFPGHYWTRWIDGLQDIRNNHRRCQRQ